MNRFDDDLRRAARGKRTTAVIASFAILVFGLVLAGYFLSFRSLSIVVQPENAKQTAMIEVTDGLAFSLASRIYAVSDQAQINISAAKYHTANLTIHGSDFGSDMTVILLPKPGRLRALVTPSTSVNWYLNGNFVSQSNRLDTELAPGDYQLAVTSDYHERVERDLTITADDDTSLAIDLPCITGTLRATMTPPGTMLVDGQPVDSTSPITLGPGPHLIDLTAPGHKSVSDSITITQTQRDFTRSYNLQPLPIRMQHQLTPPGGNLFVNGKRQDISKNTIEIPYRKRLDIEYAKPGFVTKTQSQTVAPGEMVALSLVLDPEFADITITANITADIYLDGQLLGTTPLQISVPTVPATLEVRADGYQGETKSITPKPKQPQIHEFTLITTAAAKLQNAPQSYKNANGIDFRLIKPRNARFEMGGKRSEKGQRANEFLRQIELQRPFYVATHELTEAQFYGKGSNLPVVNLSWEQVAIFCNELSIAEGLTPFYRTKNGRISGFDPMADGYRFISEAEWEFLARAYRRPKQTIFPWGDDAVVPPNVGNLAGDKAKPASDSYIAGYQDGFSGLAPAKSFPADLSGLYDFVGNVSEWTHDSYMFTPPPSDKIEIDPLGQYSAGPHVIKGANFKSASRTELRAAFRDGSDTPRDDVGFRLARYL